MNGNHTFESISERLLNYIRRRPDDSPNLRAEFNSLALAIFGLQLEHLPVYRRVCAGRGVNAGSVEHWREIPALPTRAFQDFELTCLPRAKRSRVFWSSGTTSDNQRSQHLHGPCSLRLYEASLDAWFWPHLFPEYNVARGFTAEGQVSPPSLRETLGWDLVALTPPAGLVPNSSLVHMFQQVSQWDQFHQREFCGTIDQNGAWAVNGARLRSTLEEAIRTQRRVLLLGPAFAFVQCVDFLAETGPLSLPEGSRAMETGGYKGRSRTVPRSELYTLIRDHFGIPCAQIVGEYGMCELSSQAYDRATGGAGGDRREFQFPPWARVQVISPETGREVEEGQTGLVRVLDLANVYSVASIQTEDLGVRRGSGFELIGRDPSAEVRGCSLMFEST